VNGWVFASIACALAVGFLLPRPRDLAIRRLGSGGGSPGVKSGRGSPGINFSRGAPALREINLQFPGSRASAAAPARSWLPNRRAATKRRSAVAELADALASELRAGASPRVALLRAVQDEPLLAGLAAAARSPAGDVAAALREVGALPGGGGAGDLAAAWLVCESTGGGLAAPAARLAGALRDDAQVRREVAAQLAGPKATAVLLAMLPCFGLVMGAALGADPLHLFFGTAAGPALLATGLALELSGVLWTLLIARRAAR
jgi:Flp pilus assembly protein TadB